MRAPRRRFGMGVLALSLVLASGAGAQEWNLAHLDAIQARNVGPAGMSGRVTDVEVVLSDPTVIYVGGATGGLFRSRDGGITWDPVFDDQPVLGVGSVAVFQPLSLIHI